VIRRANEADLAAVAELFRAFDREVPEPSYRDSELERELEEIAEMLRNDFTLVAEEDGQLVGYALAFHLLTLFANGIVAELQELMVAPEYRSRGIGRRLVTECIGFARDVGYRKITLWTHSQLKAARAIYEQAGFRCVRRQPNPSFGRKLVDETWELRL
jgi:GNAT superfamily N-acetyltransferase